MALSQSQCCPLPSGSKRHTVEPSLQGLAQEGAAPFPPLLHLLPTPSLCGATAKVPHISTRTKIFRVGRKVGHFYTSKATEPDLRAWSPILIKRQDKKSKYVSIPIDQKIEELWPWPCRILKQGAEDNAEEVLRGQIMKNLSHHAHPVDFGRY